MASPFFSSSYWNQPSESRYSPSSSSSSSVPLKRKPETASPKVISIPVHFVGSQSNRVNSCLNPTDSAVRIQKVFRGFLVRKSVNKLVSIKNQVEEIERTIVQKETEELIRKDSKERLRINETLMALLFKLDSVRGIDTGVRDLRKGVTRKAIALQEKVDALVMLPITRDDHPICGDDMPIEDPAAVSVDEMPIEDPAAVSVDEMPIENVDDRRICDDEVTVENDPAAVTMDEMAIENVDDQEECNCVVKEIVEEYSGMNSKTEMRKEDEEMDDWCKGEVTREDGGK